MKGRQICHETAVQRDGWKCMSLAWHPERKNWEKWQEEKQNHALGRKSSTGTLLSKCCLKQDMKWQPTHLPSIVFNSCLLSRAISQSSLETLLVCTWQPRAPGAAQAAGWVPLPSAAPPSPGHPGHPPGKHQWCPVSRTRQPDRVGRHPAAWVGN